LGREALGELIETVPLNCMYRCGSALYQNKVSGIGEVFGKAVECCAMMMGNRGEEWNGRKEELQEKEVGQGEEAVVCGLVCALEPMSTKPDLIESSMGEVPLRPRALFALPNHFLPFTCSGI
jgi:hypothetical protein